MNEYIRLFAMTAVAACATAVHAAIITVTSTNNAAVSGQTNLTQAIQMLKDADTIQFNIPGTAGQVHYLQTPPNGYPIITNNSVTIDGYSQPGASPNTNPIHAPNNAKIKICLDSRNGNGTDMGKIENLIGVPSRPGYGHCEWAVLGVFGGTNAHIHGLAILSAPVVDPGNNDTSLCDPADSDCGGPPCIKGISFARSHDVSGANWHISGCWIGVDPATGLVGRLSDGTTVATPAIAIAAYRQRDVSGGTLPDVYPQPGTIGVAAGASSPREEFNVIITGYGFDSEGLNFRISGNFWGVLPDGMTSADMSVLNGGLQLGDGFIEIGRNTSNLTIGTDGDGVNDADEGNVFGGFAKGGAVMMDLYSDPQTNIVIAGNWFGVAVDGVTRFTNSATFVDTFGSQSTARFGSDFDGVSDALEGNLVFNNNPFATQFPDPSTGAEPRLLLLSPGARVSLRGNMLVNADLLPFAYADGSGGGLNNFTNYAAPFMSTNADIIPILSPASVFPRLNGTCAVGVDPYTNIIIDVYQLDPEGWANGKLFGLQELISADGSLTNGFPQGRKYLGSFLDNGPKDSNPAVGQFSLDLSGLDLGTGLATVTANYSADPQGTHNGRTHTSNFSNPIGLIPGGTASVGLTHTVPDTLLWYNSTGNYYTNGPIAPSAQLANLANWEPNISVLGDTTFLIGANTFADDQTPPAGAVLDPSVPPFQRFVVTFQPAAGGAPKIGEEFLTDAGVPYRGPINYSRPNGNPQRVAGDKRLGAVNFITGAETSAGQVPGFQSNSRWTSNEIYTAERRYGTVQTYSLDAGTLAQTPLTKAFDAINGRKTGAFAGNTPEVSRFGGEVAALDNGNFVVVVDDRSNYSSANRTATVVIISPDGAIVKETYAVDTSINNQIWSNVAAYRGGFCVRFNATLYFYDNAGNLQGSSPQSGSGLSFDPGRGDGTRIASDIRSYYVYLAGRTPDAPTSPVSVAIWDSRTRNFVTSATVSDTDPAVHTTDRVNIAVDALDRFCVAFALRPTGDFLQNQIAARVLKFDGTKVTYLTHSFFPFVNFDANGSLGLTTINPSVAMTTRQICIAGKGTVNSTNNPAGGPNTAAETTLYTVVSHPDPQPTPGGGSLVITNLSITGPAVTISWTGGTAPYLLQMKSSLTDPTWQNVLTTPRQSESVALQGGAAFFRVSDNATNTVTPLTAFLSGDGERPQVTTGATGLGSFSLEGNTLAYNITFSGLSGPATAAHIHGPTNTTSSIGVIIPFSVSAATSGTISGSVVVSDQQRGYLLNGLSYANIHTSLNGGGEIRGQIGPTQLQATLNGANERPAPVVTGGTGSGTLTRIGNQLLFNITYSGLSSSATMAHIHGPVDTAGFAGVLLPLPTPSGTSGTISGSLPLDNATLSAIVDGLSYVNIHTQNNGGGEIRGQITP